MIHPLSMSNKTPIALILGIAMASAVAAITMPVAYSQTDNSKASVVIDPANKQNITGSIHIAFVWGERLTPPQNYIRGFINLKEAMHRYSDINTVIDSHIFLSSPAMLKMPFIYVASDNSFDISDVERDNLKKYFDTGGFMVLESATPAQGNNPARASLKQMVRDVLGAHARFTPIPESHELYHCFFDFNVPPQGAEISLRNNPVLYLEGVWYKDRLVAVYSDKGYIVKWNEMENNQPQLKMGVNFIVFALTQKGGIAQPAE